MRNAAVNSTIVLFLAVVGPLLADARQATITVEPRIISQPGQGMQITFELGNPTDENVMWVGYLTTGVRNAGGSIDTVVIQIPMAPFTPPMTIATYNYPFEFRNYRLRPHGVALMFLDDDRYNWQPPNPNPPWQWQTAANQAIQLTNQIAAFRAQHDAGRTTIENNLIALKVAMEQGLWGSVNNYAAQTQALEAEDNTRLTQIDDQEIGFASGLTFLAFGGADGGVVWMDITICKWSESEEQNAPPFEEIADANEDNSPGVLIGVNSDDDDGNGILDVAESLVGSENDMAPACWSYARPMANLMNLGTWPSAELASTGPITLWSSSSKYSGVNTEATAYASRPLWAESTSPSASAGDSSIRSTMTYSGTQVQDRVRVTSVAITTIEWNGYDANRFYQNGNFQAPYGDRWHPDKYTPASDTPVFLRAIVYVIPSGIQSVPVFGKTYDPDDPSTATDNEMNTEDNLGSVQGRKEGLLRNSDETDRITKESAYSGGSGQMAVF